MPQTTRKELDSVAKAFLNRKRKQGVGSNHARQRNQKYQQKEEKARKVPESFTRQLEFHLSRLPTRRRNPQLSAAVQRIGMHHFCGALAFIRDSVEELAGQLGKCRDFHFCVVQYRNGIATIPSLGKRINS